MKFKTNYTAHQWPTKGEINTLPSKTIPDQSLSVQQIMERYARGLPLDGVRVPVYLGDEIEFPEMERLDLTERQQLIAEARERTKLIQEELQNQEKARLARKVREAAEAKSQGKQQSSEQIEYTELPNSDTSKPSHVSPKGDTKKSQ